MYKNKTVLGFIPARGGSKGLKKKNIIPLNRKPLVIWTLEQAKHSSIIDEVLVSTENNEIRTVLKNHGYETTYIRPEKLASDSSPTYDSIDHALKWYEKKGKKFDYVLLLEPTSPLRRKIDIDAGTKLLIDNRKKADSLISLGEIHMENPYISKKVNAGYVEKLIPAPNRKIHQRQQLPASYFPYGVLYASKVESLIRYHTFYQKKTIPYFIERWQNYEIDDIYDLYCIEAIIKKKGNIL